MNRWYLMIGLLIWSVGIGAGLPLPGLNGYDEEPLPPDVAFQLELMPQGDGFVAQWNITQAYYLYRDKINITVGDKQVVAQIPSGKTIRDEFFGETQVFRNWLQVPFTVSPAPAPDEPFRVTYQGCADLGVCYPPITKVWLIKDMVLSASASDAPGLSEARSEQARIATQVGESNVLLTVLAFIGFGLLLTFTPCVLPLIPILSSMITGTGTRITTGRAFVLSLAYVLAMSVSYALAGVAIGLTGESFQIWLQTPWVIGLFVLVFVLLALSMFGLYELKMPTAIQTRLNTVGSEKSGSVVGAAIMGGVSVLIVGPCVTPPLIGALLFIAQTGNAVTGGLALFGLGIGMGIPLLAIGTSLGKWLPRPGPGWEMSKVIFGLLLLAVAIWMLDRVVALTVTQYLGALLLIMAAVYFLRIQGIKTGWRLFWQGLGGVLLIYGVMLAVAAATGGASFFKPLENLVQGNRTHTELVFQPVKGVAGFEHYQQQAVQTQQLMMLDFYADWCVACKEMEAFTFNQPQVRNALGGMIKLQTDVTENDAADKALMRQFSIFGPPAILFFDREGQEIPGARLVGFVDADAFVAHIQKMKPTG